MTRYTRHARNRLRFWQLSEADVVAVLTVADAVTPSIKGRSNAWKRRGQGWVRVTFIKEQADTVVITVTIRSRGPQGGPQP